MHTSLADWLQGWGTVAGSVFSAIAAITALALYWREVNNRKNDLEDRINRQARNVLVTVETSIRPTQLEQIQVIAHNFTNEVVLGFCYRVYRRDTGAEVMQLNSDVFEPGHRWIREVRLDPVMRCDEPEDPPHLFEFNYWFTDARGYNWHRLDRNQPELIKNAPSEEWERFGDIRADVVEKN
jgi:hypothetical protein